MNPREKGGTLLLLDNEYAYRKNLADMLRGEGFTVHEAADLEQARAILVNEKIELALLDYLLKEGHEGIELLQMPIYPLPPVVMISNKAGVSEAAKAMRLGATDFLDKTDDPDRILLVIHNQLRLGKLMRDVSEQHPLKGTSPTMQKLLERAMLWAKSPASVLILGETGTGKEAVARLLHQHSERAFKPFIVVNCPALPEGLVEAELFGHVRGAFSDAKMDHEGAFERAQGGVLYLAEIGDLPERIQSKLLQVLSDGEARRLGGSRSYKIDVRIVAATNKNPPQVLRSDFYERIAEAVLEIPPLRERREDIPEIVRYWVQRICIEEKRYREITDEAIELLCQAEWSGNVRELIRFLRHLIVLGEDGTEINSMEIRQSLKGELPNGQDPFDPKLTYKQAFACFERELFSKRQQAFKGNRQELASNLGISRGTLWEKLNKYGLAG